MGSTNGNQFCDHALHKIDFHLWVLQMEINFVKSVVTIKKFLEAQLPAERMKALMVTLIGITNYGQ